MDRHYRYLLKNILRNGAAGRMVPLKYEVWLRETTFNMGYEGTATGLYATTGVPVEIKVKRLGDVLREVFRAEGRIDLVKMDCEGREYPLFNLPAEDVRLTRQYIVEVHGSEGPIVDKMAECGYGHKPIRSVASLVAVHYFYIVS